MQANQVAVQVGDVGEKPMPGGKAWRGAAICPPAFVTRANAASSDGDASS